MRVFGGSLCDLLQSGGRGTRWGGKESGKKRVRERRSRGVETPGGKGNAQGGERSQKRAREEAVRHSSCVRKQRAWTWLRLSAPLSPGPRPRQPNWVTGLGLRPRPTARPLPSQVAASRRQEPSGYWALSVFLAGSIGDLHQPRRLSRGGGSPRPGGFQGWMGWPVLPGAGICRRGGGKATWGLPDPYGPGQGAGNEDASRTPDYAWTALLGLGPGPGEVPPPHLPGFWVATPSGTWCRSPRGTREPSGEGGALRASTFPARRRLGAPGDPSRASGARSSALPATSPRRRALPRAARIEAGHRFRGGRIPRQPRGSFSPFPPQGPKLHKPRAGGSGGPRGRQNSPSFPPAAPKKLLGGCAPGSGVSPPLVTCWSGCQAGPLDSFIATSNVSFALNSGS